MQRYLFSEYEYKKKRLKDFTKFSPKNLVGCISQTYTNVVFAFYALNIE